MTRLQQVALLVDSSSGWGRRFIEGVLTEALTHHRWHIWIAPPGAVNKAGYLPEGWRGDGIIARVVTREVARRLAGLHVPVVNVTSVSLPGVEFPRLMPDYEACCRLAVEHLTGKGFRRFAYVGPVRFPWVRVHFTAYQKVLAERGQKAALFSTPRDTGSRQGWQTWLDSLTHWLRELPKPIAIFAWSASTARVVVEACRMAEIRVPHEVAVLGSNSDGLLDRACDPPLAGVDEPWLEMGRLAAVYLDRMIRQSGEVDALTRVQPSRIIPGGSTDALVLGDPGLARAVRHIEEHAFDPRFSVAALVSHVRMARRSFERKFKEAFGRSPAEEIRHRRIARARSLLLETDLPMSEIAQVCGFATHNYLHTVFKRFTGHSPSAYRAEHRPRLRA